MARRTKAKAARLANLSASNSKQSRKATVEDVTWQSEFDDEAPLLNNDMPGMDAVSNSDPGEDYSPTGFHFVFEEDRENNGVEGSEVGSDSEPDPECSEVDEDEEDDIRNEATLLTFINVLTQAQDAALEAERKKEAGSKRPRCYMKNSKRSHRRHELKRAKIAEEGKQSFVADWLTARNKETVSNDEPIEIMAETPVNQVRPVVAQAVVSKS